MLPEMLNITGPNFADRLHIRHKVHLRDGIPPNQRPDNLHISSSRCGSEAEYQAPTSLHACIPAARYSCGSK